MFTFTHWCKYPWAIIKVDIYYGFKSDNLKWISSSFRQNQVFPILMARMIFSQIQQAPGPDFRKEGKSLHLGESSEIW